MSLLTLLAPGLGMGGGDEISLANSHLHAGGDPIWGARFTLAVPYLDADGDPTDPETPDTEISFDGDDEYQDTETPVTLKGNGWGYQSLSAVEMQHNSIEGIAKVASGPKATLFSVYPKRLPVVHTTTLAAVVSGGGTLAVFPRYDISGCWMRTMASGTLEKFNERRRITVYDTDTGEFEVEPEWDNTASVVVEDRTVDILAPEGVTVGMIRTLNPTIPGSKLDVTLTGAASINWAGVENQDSTVNLDNTRVRLHPDYDLYHADIKFTRDQSNTRDEWTVTWFMDGVAVTSGITDPTIQVVQRSDGTDLVPEDDMTEIGSTGSYKYDETTNRLVFGEAVIVIVKATIDEAEREFRKIVTLDSV